MKTEVIYSDDEIKIINGNDVITMKRSKNDDDDRIFIEQHIAMLERKQFYNSEHFINEFNEKLETAILATRHSGSGARACRDALLSLYNGTHYKANLSDWYNLDSKNKAALLFILEHQTTNNRQDIDLYLPQYQSDFTRMKNEVSDD